MDRIEALEAAVNGLKDAQAAALFAIMALSRTHQNLDAAIAVYDSLIADFQAKLIASGQMSGLPEASRFAFDALRENLLFGSSHKEG